MPQLLRMLRQEDQEVEASLGNVAKYYLKKKKKFSFMWFSKNAEQGSLVEGNLQTQLLKQTSLFLWSF